MHFEPQQVYHVYNRGNNKQPIFFRKENYSLFLQKINKLIIPNASILCWCLMPNHFHFILMPTISGCTERIAFGNKGMQELSYSIGVLLSSYSQLMNRQNNTVGSLFQQKTKSKQLYKTEDIIRCLHYIHQNPFRAGLTNDRWVGWVYSSYMEYTETSLWHLCDQGLLYSLTGYNKTSLIHHSETLITDYSAFY